MKKTQKRTEQALKNSFDDSLSNSDVEVHFLISPSDFGVRRNMGRAGARFGGDSILYELGKMNNHKDLKKMKSSICSSQNDESIDFHTAQETSTNKILNILNESNGKLIHIGGGHDHAYPMLCALKKRYKKIAVFNLDAHCDTRQEEERHSGTPFRDFDQICDKFYLFQYGIHQYANSTLTQAQLDKGKMFFYESENFNRDSVTQVIESFKANCNFEIDEETMVYISLDCDALHSSYMSAVSAVNHNGLELNHTEKIIHELKTNFKNTMFGMYEYNPLFEDLSNKGARALSHLIYSFL